MSGTRGGFGRIVAMGIGLALALLLLIAGEARAGAYAVAQCGWYIGADAEWADTTGGAKFRPDAFCVPSPPADPFDGSHLKSFTRDGQGTISGTRFARWRWVAAPGTGITQVRGTWWHALHDGIEQRLGTEPGGGGFNAFGVATLTDTTPREFVVGFATPQAAFEDRLLCAKAESKWCSLDAGSWSALRAVTITVADDLPPWSAVGGPITSGGWLRGWQGVFAWAWDNGSGVGLGETRVDGARVAVTEYPCAKVLIGGQWRATQMRPCGLAVSTPHDIATMTFSDGPHSVVHCAIDFAANAGCSTPITILLDNNPPAHPRSPALPGGEGWRRTDDFDLTWANPDQAPGSPLVGASWRLSGPAGYDTGVQFAAGRDRASLSDLEVPAPGAYLLQVWLRDEAGNEAPASAVTVPLRFDDQAPRVSFAGAESAAVPDRVVAAVADPLAGPGAGQILYRRADSERWLELPTKLLGGADPGQANLVAPMPDLTPGTYLFRADAADRAGNTASTTLRADGTQMVVRQLAPVEVEKGKARLFARLGGGRGDGDALTVAFGAATTLSGRLTRADGAGLGGRELRIVSRPSRGALVSPESITVRTAERGDFELRLPPGPSRRITVAFPGDGSLEPASRSPLELRVRSGVSLRATPTTLRTGQVVRLSGRIRDRAAPIPRRGKLVAIQYLEAASGRWRPVLVTRSDHDGRFRAQYRFRYISDPTAIRLRATALAEERWPYAPGSSSPVTVMVDDR